MVSILNKKKVGSVLNSGIMDKLIQYMELQRFLKKKNYLEKY